MPSRISIEALAFLSGALVIALLTCSDIFFSYWRLGENGQAPIVLLAAVYAYYERRQALFATPLAETRPALGFAAGGAALLVFIFGRLGGLLQLEAIAIPLLAIALCLLLGGDAALRRMWPINLALIAVIPLPESLADVILLPLKELIAHGVVDVLGFIGYPVAVNGVVISIGFVQLQIANACSGLWSMLSLVAIGLLHEYFVRSSRRLIAVVFLCAVVPIALLANFLRVMLLVMVAYYGGSDAEAQVHDIAQYLELALSLGLFVVTHLALEKLLGRRRSA